MPTLEDPRTIAALTQAVALLPSTPDAVLEQLARHSSQAVRKAVAVRPSTPRSLLDAALQDRAPSVRAAATAVHPDAPVPAAAASSKLVALRRAAAANPTLPADLLEKLASDGDLGVRRSVVTNPSSPDATVDGVLRGLRSPAYSLFGGGQAAGKRVAGVGLVCAGHLSTLPVWLGDRQTEVRRSAVRFVTDLDDAKRVREASVGLYALATNPFIAAGELSLTSRLMSARQQMLQTLDGLDLAAPGSWSVEEQVRVASVASATLDLVLLDLPGLSWDAAQMVLTRAGSRTREVVPSTDVVGRLIERFGWDAARLARRSMEAGRSVYANPWSPRVSSLVAAAAVDVDDPVLAELAKVSPEAWAAAEVLAEDWAGDLADAVVAGELLGG